MPTKARIHKVERILSDRYSDLRIVLEEVKNTHNASAVVRTCDAAGIQFLDIISADGNPFPVNEAISTRAEKWLHMEYHANSADCLLSLREKGFIIMATKLSPEALPYTEMDFTQPCALVFGNEAEGISSAVSDHADHLIHIPMKGMAQSLNLSVSVGIILYEAIRQRYQNPDYKTAGLDAKTYRKFKKEWLNPRKLNGEEGK